ncbi:hypothetical protein [Flavisericum labens]|uniref:hypothetical protein n=1 Tax=Flavisericum labens TaxID=3377112 RepID=UPI00387B2878
MKQIITYFIVACLFGTSSFSQSKIGKAEESVKNGESDSENPKSEYSNSEINTDDDIGFLTEIIGGFFIQVFTYTAYALAIESPFELEGKASHAFITKYPYYNSNKGNYDYTWSEDISIFRTDLSGRYISENNRLKGTHLNLEMRFLKRVSLEADYLQLWENNPNFGTDNLAIYSMIAKYHRVRTEKFDAWWGLGASYIDGTVNEFGFTYGLGAEWFFAKPLSAEIKFNQTLINSETVNKFNGLLNYHHNQYKFTGGYERLKIGSQGFSMITLGVGIYL